jgi:hypothetical protein
MFARERAVVADATEAAKRSINTSLVVASVAVILALVAVVVVVARG